jgi:hypothetical protein
MLNIGNANDSIMKGQTRFARFKRQFKVSWNEPLIEATKAGIWNSMPAEIKENLKVQNPELYKTMNKRYGGDNER